MFTHNEYVAKVVEIIAEQISAGDIDHDKPLREQGADSLDDIELTMAFESEFNIDIFDEDVEKLTTVNLIVAFLENRLGVKDP